MKIKNKLFLIFFVMTVFPVCITLIMMNYILNRQLESISKAYSIDKSQYSSIEVFFNPVNLICDVTKSEYDEINTIAKNTPDLLASESFLSIKAKKLQKGGSYLFVYKSCDNIFASDLSKAHFGKDVINNISFSYHPDRPELIYMNSDKSTVYKEATFRFSNGDLGQFFVVTDFSQITPTLNQCIIDITLLFFVIIVLSGILFVFLTYRILIYPLKILQVAALNFTNGELDKPVVAVSSDEIGELCQCFEDMRVRLKETIDEHVKTEEMSRDIMSSFSHDLKTPITAIKGYAEGLIDGVADTREKQLKYLHTIYAKANDMTYLVDELSFYSKVNRSTLAYNFITVNADDYFKDCIEDFSLDLESKNITIDYFNNTNRSTRIIVDVEQIKRVLNNLIGNAAKYMDKPDGHIFVRVTDAASPKTIRPVYRRIREDGTDIEPQETSTDDFIQIQVEDNGPGIAAKDIPHLFEKFYRADASRNSTKRGSGLGLAIVEKLVSDHGGNVWVDSTEGTGSSFYFTLKKENLFIKENELGGESNE